MNAVDVFDQLSFYNPGLRRVKRGAHQAVEHWLLRVVLENTYTIAQMVLGEDHIRPAMRNQKAWRDRIIDGLLAAANREPIRGHQDPINPKRQIGQISTDVLDTPLSEHEKQKSNKKDF
ncbi:hypothetical protein BJ878DRAFT_576918 [Calycina marina]|uniref:Uncharacterized protein n=1 Tax=Calycina marina TaxID=1763456 RepID=A0A9P7Z0C4_9HELO|nr:hypothetical protein BJ878DRAFT_576918 [Calycina marina]